jgi:hypothetical protein
VLYDVHQPGAGRCAMSTVSVASVIATKYRNGGNARAVLNWVHGLRQLGVQTYYVEQIASPHCIDDSGQTVPFAESANVAYFEHVMREAGLTQASALICDGGPQTSGVAYREMLDIADSADLLLNVTGHLTLEPLMRRLRRKAYLDLDPGFTQFWHASGQGGDRLSGHDFHFTIGENIGTPDCRIPCGDIRWRHTRQPGGPQRAPGCHHAMDREVHDHRKLARPYGPVQALARRRRLEGARVQEAARPAAARGCRVRDRPRHPSADARDLDQLRAHGWRVVDPMQVVPDPQSFDDYIQGSDAECSAAQGV